MSEILFLKKCVNREEPELTMNDKCIFFIIFRGMLTNLY